MTYILMARRPIATAAAVALLGVATPALAASYDTVGTTITARTAVIPRGIVDHLSCCDGVLDINPRDPTLMAWLAGQEPETELAMRLAVCAFRTAAVATTPGSAALTS